MAVYGYIRASADTDEAARSERAILDCATARGMAEPEFARERASLLFDEKCRAGDTVIVAEISGAARSMQQIHQLLTVCAARRITLVIARGNIAFVPGDGAGSILSLEASALFADFEREIMLAASKEAVAARRKKK